MRFGSLSSLSNHYVFSFFASEIYTCFSILAECPQNHSSGTTFILCLVNGTMECVPDADNDCVPDNEVKMLECVPSLVIENAKPLVRPTV